MLHIAKAFNIFLSHSTSRSIISIDDVAIAQETASIFVVNRDAEKQQLVRCYDSEGNQLNSDERCKEFQKFFRSLFY